jgi:hypothetical protein
MWISVCLHYWKRQSREVRKTWNIFWIFFGLQLEQPKWFIKLVWISQVSIHAFLINRGICGICWSILKSTFPNLFWTHVSQYSIIANRTGFLKMSLYPRRRDSKSERISKIQKSDRLPIMLEQIFERKIRNSNMQIDVNNNGAGFPLLQEPPTTTGCPKNWRPSLTLTGDSSRPRSADTPSQ